MKHIIYIIIFLLPIFATAQRWKAERHSVFFGLGMSNFMGDLGGGSADAAHFLGARDIDIVTTRPTVNVGYRIRLFQELAAKAQISYIWLEAKDAASQSEGRNMRNLNFRSHVWEFSAQIEYSFIVEKERPRYSFSSLSSLRNVNAYFFIGIGIFTYNPKTYFNGEWIELRPLKTEGQGLDITYISQDPSNYGVKVTTPSPYTSTALCFPIGIGVRYNLDRQFTLGLEISNRYTTTDYLDDASGRYFNYAEMKQRNLISDYDPILDQITDRHLKPDGTPADKYLSGKTMRGSPSFNDAYVLTVFTLYYKLKTTIKGQPKF